MHSRLAANDLFDMDALLYGSTSNDIQKKSTPLTKNAAAALLEQQPYLVKSTELECVFGPGNG